ncbi:MAG: metal ABC transporter permease [Nitrospina sp.]|nr:metal ABC transporter permease [Nitrospina sp.]MBT3510541.1 metal ABC transporter permease [Nitrospina sp.]MBT3874495.1 metal ABC transporter permease [Nitrospina sp.]MBT4049902.1 metal ABC transporter permease [Nitrospina sp.]MBT4557832.1 metal ABC transporter permease [Nitrospina sp.]
MSDFLTFMAAPAAACLIFSGVFTYFGCHVLKREIIFVDIALAQLAALGVTLADTFQHENNKWETLLLSLFFVLAGSAFFSYTRRLTNRVPQEAIIGIVYVVGASLTLLLASQSVHGAEQLRNILNGSILWITWSNVLTLLVLVAIIAVPHWVFRENFWKLSDQYRQFKKGDREYIWWDFLFYLSLGLVIVTSVKTAGIFLIFTFLIVPAVIVALFSAQFKTQLIFGSLVSAVTSLFGLVLSFNLDLPTGATLVCCFGIVFAGALFIAKKK